MASPFIRHLPLVSACAVVLTVLFQWNLVSALVRDRYASQPQMVMESDDEVYYLSLIREVARHPGQAGSPFVLENRTNAWTYPMGTVRVAGGLMRFMDWDIKTTSMVLDLVCPFFISLLVLGLFLCWFEGRTMGYIAGVAYLTLPSLFGFWQRPVSPQLTFLPLLATLIVYASWKWKSVWREVLLGAGGGVLFYTYPFHWTFILPLFLLDDIWTIWKSKQLLREQFLKYLILGIVASGAIASMIHLNHQPLYTETMQRLGLLHDRSPTGIPLQLQLTGLLIVFYVCVTRLDKTSWWTLTVSTSERQMIIGIVTGFLVLNQAFITGAQLEFNAHYQPLMLLFAVALFGRVIERGMERLKPRYRRIGFAACAILICAACASGLSLHLRRNPFRQQDAMNTPEAHEVYGWIREHAPSDAVVSVPSELFHGIPLYTNAYLQFSDLEWFLIGPTSELLDRFVDADPKNTTLMNEVAVSQRMLLGFTYLAPIQKREPRIRLLKKLHIPVTESSVTIPSEIQRVASERAALTPERWQADLAYDDVKYIVMRTGQFWPPVPPGRTVFENTLYRIQEL